MNTTTATRTSPDYIAADTHTGRWSRVGIPAGMRADTFTAAELATLFGAEFTVWEHSGHVRDGRPLFVRSRFVPNADGSISGYDSHGRLVIVHPAGRTIGILTR